MWTLFQAQRGDEIFKLGSAEIRVFGAADHVYAAPDLIYHYVVDYQYSPPQEFIQAVLASPLLTHRSTRNEQVHTTRTEL